MNIYITLLRVKFITENEKLHTELAKQRVMKYMISIMTPGFKNNICKHFFSTWSGRIEHFRLELCWPLGVTKGTGVGLFLVLNSNMVPLLTRAQPGLYVPGVFIQINIGAT